MKHVFRLAAFALIISMVPAFTGCGLFSGSSKYDPEVTSIYVRDDRTIRAAEIVDFDNSAYSEPRYFESELREFVYSSIKEYNKTAAGLEYVSADDTKEKLPVALVSIEVKNNVARLILDFASSTHYLQFYGTTEAVPVRNLIVGSVRDGVNSGLKFEGMLDGDGAAAGYADVTDGEDYTLVAIKGDITVQTEGKIQFYSKTLTMKDEYTVVASGQDTNYIIFK